MNKVLLIFYLELLTAFFASLLVFFLFIGAGDVLSRSYPASWIPDLFLFLAAAGSLLAAALGVYVVLIRNVRES